MSITIRAESTILFTGDSITDGGRDRANGHDLGDGYPAMIARRLAGQSAARDVRVLNRGISGNEVGDLRERWVTDCLELEPDILSVLIGINDAGHRFRPEGGPDVASFEVGYRSILRDVRAMNPDLQIMLVEPFLLDDVVEERKPWRTELDPRIDIVHRLAVEFEATLLPADQIFARLAATRTPQPWCFDGVHPTLEGHQVLAREWLNLAEIEQRG